MENKFNRNTNRDIVFVFGAGASYADGAPLQAEILPIIMSDSISDIAKSPLGQFVREFISDNFAWDADLKIYPTLETIFGFLDYFINQDEHLSSKYPNRKIRLIKEGLIKLIHYVISVKSCRGGKTYQSFWESIRQYNSNVSILTLNYDTLLEEALNSMLGYNNYINYVIHLMNFDLPDTCKDEGIQELYPVKIMKGHGSLNWKYCNCCNQVLLTAWDTQIDLSIVNLEGNDGGNSKHLCPIDASEFETLIIPPSHIKKISHPIISQILNEAMREIRSCKKIVFVGYSFPDADVHFKALFKKSLNEDKEIIIVNNSKKEKLLYNYQALSRNIKFINSSFAEWLANQLLVEEILTEYNYH